MIKEITVLNFNIKDETIAFQSIKSVDTNTAKIQSSSVFLLYKLHDSIEFLTPDSKPLWNLISKKNNPNHIGFNEDIYDKDLDESQSSSLRQALNNDITNIWGPPGTGKSHTLARVALNLYKAEETTVVCAIANVAVDGLVEKTIDLLKEYKWEKNQNLLTERKIMRIGYAQSEKVRSIPEIKFENPDLIQLAAQISTIETQINKKENSKKNIRESKKSYLN